MWSSAFLREKWCSSFYFLETWPRSNQHRSFDQFFLSNKKPCRLPVRYCRCQLGNNTSMRSEETWMDPLEWEFMKFSDFDNLPIFEWKGKLNHAKSRKFIYWWSVAADLLLFILKYDINRSLSNNIFQI